MATTDGSGNATWQDPAAVGIVTGNGTLNFMPKWTPDGTNLGNSLIFDNGVNIGIGTTTPVFKTEIATTGGDDGLRLITTNSNNIRFRMHNTTVNKEYSMLVGGTGSGFGSGNFVLTDVGSGDAVRLLINGATGNVGIGGGTLNPGARLQVEQSAASGGGLFVNHSNASNTSDALRVATNGTGFAANFTNTNAVPRALRTQGALQFTGIGEGVNRILMTDVSGNANWNTLSSVGGVSGTGTLNVVPKWTPNGTFIGNSQIFDDGTFVGIGTLTPSAKLHVAGNQKIDSAFTLEFGAGISKEANAGKIGYNTFTPDALDIVGAGTLGTNRKINFFAEGGAVFNGNVGIGIANPSFRLDINGNTPGYLAQFNNLNTGNGDGIKIKLGRTHPLWIENESRYHTATNLSTTFGPQLNMVRDWVLHGTAPNVFELLSSTGALLVGTLCVLTNRALQEANNLLGLPIILWDVTIVPSIPELNCTGFPAVQIPGLASSNVANSLTDLNNFIQFADKDDRQLGAIRAQSIVDWRTKTLDAGYFFELAGKFVGVDLVKGFVHGGSAMFKLGTAFNKIGVEYMSGHGDYAEWLERSDVNERISYGDIVGIKGGKISKDLSGAEQIMVASHRPIVLGNMPQEEKKPFGNAVAFMGQVPVKVMGPVASGDYIVAKGEFAGMGIAMNPLKMSADDFRFAVGRSWDTNENEGPKMVNTVVGVHNNDFLKIVSGMQQRLDAIEAKLNIGQELKTQTNKKSF